MNRRPLALAGLSVVLLVASGAAQTGRPAATSGETSVSIEQSAADFDAVAATDAYLARLSPAEKARSDAYFEGGYWLQLWSFLYGLGVVWLLLGTYLSARMRDLAERARSRWLQTALYAVQFVVVVSLLELPLALYTGFFREHKYGLATQSLGGWLGDWVKGLGVALVLGTLSLVLLYAVLRRAPRSWWIWGAGLSVLLLAVGMVIAPVFIAPIFNEYTLLEDERIRQPILRLAAANGVPAENVWVSDASRQSTRISANVSGFLGTERITLNDNLLKRASLPEIEAVMGHEIGHYVLNHVYEGLLQMGSVVLVGFAFLRFAFDPVRRRFGGSWGIRGIDDPAGLPLLVALFSVYLFVVTPVTNTIIRTNEAEADLYGINASGQPDGFAEVALKLGEYRKLDPGPIEEWIFFDHPSGRSRILAAMRWKGAHRSGEEPTSAGVAGPERDTDGR